MDSNHANALPTELRDIALLAGPDDITQGVISKQSHLIANGIRSIHVCTARSQISLVTICSSAMSCRPCLAISASRASAESQAQASLNRLNAPRRQAGVRHLCHARGAISVGGVAAVGTVDVELPVGRMIGTWLGSG